MSLTIDPNIQALRTLSSTLGANIVNAEADARRSKEQLDALIYSRTLVDESIKTLISGFASPLYQNIAQTTLYPSGSMALPFCEQFNQAAPGSGRSLLANQIQTTIQAGVSAYISENTKDTQSGLEPLKQKLAIHTEELMSLESSLDARLSKHSEHLQIILRGALESFRDATNPLRFVNTGTALRELLREFLAEVAPDSKVEKAPWFVPAADAKGGVTRRHRIDYAIFKNLTGDKFPNGFSDQTAGIADALLKNVGQLSKLTHVTEQILDKSYSEAAPLFTSVMQRFILLISGIESSRALVEEEIVTEINAHLDSLFTEDFFDELDILSTHTRPQGAVDVEIATASFDEEFIIFTGHGTVECDLQWGSDGDVRRGDGAEGSDSFPFTFSGRAEISDPSKIEIDRNSISINTGSFYEDGDE